MKTTLAHRIKVTKKSRQIGVFGNVLILKRKQYLTAVSKLVHRLPA